MLAGHARTIIRNGGRILAVLSIGQVDMLLGVTLHQGTAVAGQARGMHTIEGINAVAHAHENVLDAADAQQVYRPVPGQARHGHGHHLVHLLLISPQGAPHRMGKEIPGVHIVHTLGPQVRIHAPLDDAVQGLTAVIAPVKFRQAAIAPTMTAAHGFRCIVLVHMEGRALVQHDDQIGPQFALHIDRDLRRQDMVAAIQIGLEGGAFLRNVAHGLGASALTTTLDFLGHGPMAQTEDLEAALVREHGAIPARHLLQAAQLGHGLGPWLHHQMVGIRQDDLGMGRP